MSECHDNITAQIKESLMLDHLKSNLWRGLYVPFCFVLESFNKIRWNTNDGDSILKGDVSLSDDGLNIKIKSAAYYFLYIRVQFSKSRKLKHV